MMLIDSSKGFVNELKSDMFKSRYRFLSFMYYKGPISNWLALKMQIWLVPYTWSRHWFVAVAMAFHRKRYQELAITVTGCE